MKLKTVPWQYRLIERIDTVTALPCWIWTGYRDKDGYGTLTVDNRSQRATRLMMRLGDRDPGEQWVLHHCDNPPCVNPAHLYLGTVVDNHADSKRRARSIGRRGNPPGQDHPAAKLTWEQVRQIRALRYSTSQATIAERFGVSQATVGNILRNKSWKEEA